jgi:hypothetical protein
VYARAPASCLVCWVGTCMAYARTPAYKAPALMAEVFLYYCSKCVCHYTWECARAECPRGHPLEKAKT